jgi:putative Holliday junction resolvase
VAIVAVDYGTKRFGVAVSESELIASPHSVIENRGNLGVVIDELVAIAREYDAATFVVGIPVRNDRSEAEERVRGFVDALRQKSCKEVVLWDEAYSTTEAASLRRELNKGRRDERHEIDMHAATVILQSFLDDRHRRKP